MKKNFTTLFILLWIVVLLFAFDSIVEIQGELIAHNFGVVSITDNDSEDLRIADFSSNPIVYIPYYEEALLFSVEDKGYIYAYNHDYSYDDYGDSGDYNDSNNYDDSHEWATGDPEAPYQDNSSYLVYEVSLGVFELTAYCPCVKCCGEWSAYHESNLNTGFVQKTESGTTPVAGRTVAADPNVIPLGTEIIINGESWVAEDTGSAIKGNRIDIYFDSHQEALEFGRQQSEVFGFKDCCGDWTTQTAYKSGT